jgi:hypothetical protein
MMLFIYLFCGNSGQSEKPSHSANACFAKANSEFVGGQSSWG